MPGFAAFDPASLDEETFLVGPDRSSGGLVVSRTFAKTFESIVDDLRRHSRSDLD